MAPCNRKSSLSQLVYIIAMVLQCGLPSCLPGRTVHLHFSLQLDDEHENSAHNHSPDTATIEAVKVTSQMRDAVEANPTLRPTQVIASHLMSAPTAAQAAIGSKEIIRRRVRRQK